MSFGLLNHLDNLTLILNNNNSIVHRWPQLGNEWISESSATRSMLHEIDTCIQCVHKHISTCQILHSPPEQWLHSVNDVSQIKGQRHAGVIHTPEGPVHWGLLGGQCLGQTWVAPEATEHRKQKKSHLLLPPVKAQVGRDSSPKGHVSPHSQNFLHVFIFIFASYYSLPKPGFHLKVLWDVFTSKY